MYRRHIQFMQILCYHLHELHAFVTPAVDLRMTH